MFFTHQNKSLREYSSKELAFFVLDIVAAGTLVVSVVVAPGLGIVFKKLGVLKREERNRLVRKVRLMEQNGYLHNENGKYTLTEKGKQKLSEVEVWEKPPMIPKRWDGRWHFVLFDIPAKKSQYRKLLRDRLKELGYVHYQDSVYVHKYDMHKLVGMFADFYMIRKYLRFVEVSKLEMERDIEKHFSPQKQNRH